ncbi:MAG: DUF4097 domain-containing protein [Gemmatimonadaceae bacterium]|jgi:hypothetical protein|nr:DUF4097 domain-containing protein [Gemmatimonadaceae bacterium]
MIGRQLIGALAALALVGVPLAAQDAARVDTTVALSRTGIVDISLISGTIIVRGGAGEQAHVVASAASGSVYISSSGGMLRLGVRPGRSAGRGGENRFEVEVPRGVRVIAGGTSADVEVIDTRGDVEVRSTSGDITIVGARNRVSASGTSSAVRIRDVEGVVRAGTVSGDLELVDIVGGVEVSTVSGDLFVRGGRISDIAAESVSGDIELATRIEAAGRYEVRAHSGDILVRVDERAPLLLAVETFSGEIDSALPAVMQPSTDGSRRSRRMELAVGDAGARSAPRLVLTTFSGDISIRRGGER